MEQRPNSMKLLVVDDNPKNLQVVVSILYAAHYEIGFAMNGLQALELLKSSPDYDLILLDIKMPVIDGYEFCRMIKKDEKLKEIPVIFLSAANEMDNIIAAFEAGGVDYVTKPFNSKELLARVETHLLLKQKTEEVKNIARDLELLNLTKDKFFSIIAHDLRNPFESIRIICSKLLSGSPSLAQEGTKEQIEMIEEVTEGAAKLLQNLLTWARSQTGSISFNPGDYELSPVIEECITNVRLQAQSKDIDINTAYGMDIRIFTDHEMFCHILRNLLTNAIKFSGAHSTINVDAVRTEGGIEVSVTDTGIGISKGDIDRLFRIDGNVASRRGTMDESGTGLGLLLCKEFADKMGGKIFVESEEGKGSRFTLCLPFVEQKISQLP